MTEVTIGRARDTDLAEILEDYPRFWGTARDRGPCTTRCS